VREQDGLARIQLRPEPGATSQGRPRAAMLLVVAAALIAVVASLAAVGDHDVQLTAGQEAPPPTAAEDEPEESDASARDALPADTVAAWTRSRLPEGYADLVAGSESFAHTSMVRAGTYRLVRTEDVDGTVVSELPDGWWYPVELLALDPATYDDLADRPLLGPLEEDEALLSESSAEVRGLAEGALLAFEGGTELRVAGVVPDGLVGAGEIIVRADGPLVPERERYVLVRPTDALPDPAAVEAHLTELLPEDRALGIALPDEVPFLRHSAGVTAPSRMKVHFGEFPMREAAGRNIEPGHSWTSTHIAVEEVPIIGRVQCHEALIEPLRAALEEIVERGLAHTIDRSDYGGCWVARTQGGEQGPLSSHAWGTSIDFNVSDNHLGTESSQDERLIEIMAKHGFSWGGEWLLPDPMHFELVPDHDLG
jgi:hypothetical protein